MGSWLPSVGKGAVFIVLPPPKNSGRRLRLFLRCVASTQVANFQVYLPQNCVPRLLNNARASCWCFCWFSYLSGLASLNWMPKMTKAYRQTERRKKKEKKRKTEKSNNEPFLKEKTENRHQRRDSSETVIGLSLCHVLEKYALFQMRNDVQGCDACFSTEWRRKPVHLHVPVHRSHHQLLDRNVQNLTGSVRNFSQLLLLLGVEECDFMGRLGGRFDPNYLTMHYSC